jgi:dihydrofolate reductase
MGNVIMWNVVTVDGYFEGAASWDLSWHDAIWSDDLEKLSIEQLEAADALLFGRVTYEGMAAYWKKETGVIADYMNSLPKYVVSTTLKTADWNNSKIIKSRVEAEIGAMKQALKKDIFVFGSSKLVHSLIRADLIDEFRIGIAPHLHGSGNLLFKPGLPERDLELVDIRRVLNYRPKKSA